MLQEIFISLAHKYTSDKKLITTLWTEIETNYSGTKRYYHTLHHLENVFNQLVKVKDQINNWEAILFTLFYHDVIYKAVKSNNEEKSAELAKQRMRELGVSKEVIELSTTQILATKSHAVSLSQDTNYFTDADLCVLGQSWEAYKQYYKGVRQEYAIYPGLLYNPGRKKVLVHFLAMDNIYKTTFFQEAFEAQARENIKREIELL